ncbi:hypothetical protein EHP00_1504 [Ecytonucleospora hepatopenaei]|uniref:Uncharacterized protein n=1 Tax=Ecytonucleospora hepatopenaei TaxID=646526 RepID=A0A1W0E3R4_9MICR|nr:hypothetical protein EHP00_1504 [Ecytonucleospora hepatopenaei]
MERRNEIIEEDNQASRRHPGKCRREKEYRKRMKEAAKEYKRQETSQEELNELIKIIAEAVEDKQIRKKLTEAVKSIKEEEEEDEDENDRITKFN